MTSQALSVPQANLKITLWQVEADSMSSSDLYIWLSKCGLPTEVVLRLHELMTFTKKVGQKVIAIGKILLIKIIEFVKAHPFLVVGAGIGAVVGSAITALITSIPFIGPLLSPIAIALGITITVVGTVAGHGLDKILPNFGQDIFEIAQIFFQLFADVFNIIFRNVVTA